MGETESSSVEDRVKKCFFRDVAAHRVEIAHDKGVNRRIRFRKPGTGTHAFELVTWPGRLCITGYCGTYVFQRVEDMFEFFRTPEPNDLRINPHYWKEKVLAADIQGGIEKFSEKIFEREIKEAFRENFPDCGIDPGLKSFSGGLDAEMFQPWHVELLKTIRLKYAWFACDYPGAMPQIERAADLLADFSREKKRCYILIGYNGETVQQAEKRLEAVYHLGFLPMAMLYRGPDLKLEHRSVDWLKLRRTWVRPAAYKREMASKQVFSDLDAAVAYSNDLAWEAQGKTE